MGTSTDSRSWSDRGKTLAAAALIAVAALAAYHNTFRVPFVFDDASAILQNPGIRRLWPLWQAFHPQSPASAVDGRPVANFTLAINYALSGTSVWSYHILNLLIHVCAGLTLFGVVRRTITGVGRGRRTLPLSGKPAFGSAGQQNALKKGATPIALAVALLWTLHPLQTEAVTYVVQRVESLMGLFYLLTLYCFIRGVRADDAEAGGPQAGREGARQDRALLASRAPYNVGSGNCRAGSPDPASSAIGRAPSEVRNQSAPSTVWFTLSFLCCLLGMATKEVMVTAPVMVLLYDRTFVAGTFRNAWRRRRKLHLGLASTWLLLAVLVAGTGWNRGGASGFNVGITPTAYWLTQFEAVARYLWLTVWPHPQVFDYGTFWVHDAGAVVPFALVVVPLAVAAVWALWRAPAAGFLGAWFFGILAVTSGVPGTIQMIVEHRMYLPLAAVITAAVLGLHALVQRRTFTLTCTLTLAVALGLLSARRNADYRSELALWSDTVAKRPESPRARNALAFALDEAGRIPEAVHQFETALGQAQDGAELHDNLGVTLARAGRTAEAIAQFETALRLRPNFPVARNNFGNALLRAGEPAAAIVQFEEALRLRPDYTEAHYNLAGALDQSGRLPEALGHLEVAVRLQPDFAGAHYNLGDLLDRLGRTAEARTHYEEALRIEPGLAEAQVGLGVLLCRNGQLDTGLAHLSEAVRLRPDFVPAHFNLGVALMRAGRIDEAAAEFKEVLRLQPDHAAARRNLELVRARSPAGKSTP